ncbi:MAG: hypothetical protein DHS20C09_20900 [marine bacterium B5-7]|nr:MAG: hypothetical protein DHS20C09_20900 [marine bacterium B5-7]
MKLGEKIRELRLLKQKTLEEFAEDAGLSVSYISYLERGKRKINFESIEKISAALEIPVPVLILLSATKDELTLESFNLSDLQNTVNDFLVDHYEQQGFST